MGMLCLRVCRYWCLHSYLSLFACVPFSFAFRRNGGRGFAFTLGLSVINFCVKPLKGTQMHLSTATGDTSDRLLAGLKGCAMGTLSGLGSLCCGIPSSVLLLTSATCVGALNQIQAVPMLEAVSVNREKRRTRRHASFSSFVFAFFSIVSPDDPCPYIRRGWYSRYEEDWPISCGACISARSILRAES